MNNATLETVRITAVDSSYLVEAVWSGVDRPVSGGVYVKDMPTACRLRHAIAAGKAYPNPTIKTDVNGKTYVDHELAVRGRVMNADLKRLGF